MSDDINKMDFKKLRNEVQLLRDELAMMKRKYEDILYNLDIDNFSSRFVKEQGDMKASIEVTAEEIKSMVTDKDLESSISQTANNITMTVNRIFTKIEKVSSISKVTDSDKIYSVDGKNYYYNTVTEKAEEIESQSIGSAFIQTADGFILSGDVKITGDAVVGGTITGAALINSNGTTKLILGHETGSNFGDLKLIRVNTSGAETELFQVKDDLTVVYLTVRGSNILYSSGVNTYPQGTWNFTDANVINIRPKFA